MAAARDYLLRFDGVNDEIIRKHMDNWKGKEPGTLSGVYRALLGSAQNRRHYPSVIGDVDKLAPVLYGFNPLKVADAYDSDDEVRREIAECGIVPKKRLKRETWVQFSKSIVSAASFLRRFRRIGRWRTFVESFYGNEYTRYALPMVLDKEIHGVGFALACDFLKENGYPEFVKPDGHIKNIFHDLGLVRTKKDYEVFVRAIKFAQSVGETPYAVDKLLWLVGSGKFYLVDGLRVPSDRDEFIRLLKRSPVSQFPPGN